jgi:2'-hydroxyisoflavone reductase
MVPANVDAAKATDTTWLRPSTDKAPRMQCENTSYGFRYAAIRKPIHNPDTTDYVRVTVYVAPFTCLIPPNNAYNVASVIVPAGDLDTVFYFLAWTDGSKPGIDEDDALAVYTGKDAMAETQESLRADIENLYGPLKALSEAEAHKQFGKRVTIVRPGYIVGPRDETDRFTYWPHRVAQGGEMLVPGDGADPVQFIDGRDLGEWMIRLAEAGTLGAFNALGPAKPLTMDEMLRACEKATRAKPTYTHVTPEFLEAQKAPELPIWVSSKSGEFAGYGAVSNARAIAAGLTYRPLETTVTDLLAWFRSQPAERQATLRAGLTREQEAALLKAWHARKA